MISFGLSACVEGEGVVCHDPEGFQGEHGCVYDDGDVTGDESAENAGEEKELTRQHPGASAFFSAAKRNCGSIDVINATIEKGASAS